MRGSKGSRATAASADANHDGGVAVVVGASRSALVWCGPGTGSSTPREEGGRHVHALALALLVAAVALTWAAAVLSGRDSRDGRDWRSGPGLGDRPHRVGD